MNEDSDDDFTQCVRQANKPSELLYLLELANRRKERFPKYLDGDIKDWNKRINKLIDKIENKRRVLVEKDFTNDRIFWKKEEYENALTKK